MKRFTKYFLRGLFALLPAAVTVIVLISFFQWIDSLAAKIFSGVGSDFYFPGLGLLIGLTLICFLGFLTTLPFTVQILEMIELPLRNTPIVKSVFSAIKNLSDYFSPTSEQSNKQVVLVKYPGSDVQVMGLVTRSNLTNLPSGFPQDDRIAVYIPLSYQVGGITVFIPRAWTTKINMPVEEAMRNALTAWIQNS